MSATIIATAALAFHASAGASVSVNHQVNHPIVAPAQVGPLAHSPSRTVTRQPVVVHPAPVRPIVTTPVRGHRTPTVTVTPTHRIVIERGHGPVVRRPIVVQPVYHPIYQPVYQPVYQAPVQVIDNCNTQTNAYVGPIGSLPDSYSNGMEALTAPTSIHRGEETIQLGAQVGPIDTLVLQADAGTTRIDTIQVNFLDGTSQELQIGGAIDASNPQLTLDLGHSAVSSLTVYGSSGAGATYQLLAA